MKQPAQERNELLALASWLQTFPEFTSSLYNDGNEENVDVKGTLALLDTSHITIDVCRVAEAICGVSVDLALAKSPLDTEGTASDRDSHSGLDLMWQSLKIMSESRARPLPPELQFNNEKTLVLSHLLDCAVHVPDKQQRRTYIGRIMSLKKSTQKTIMAMIESRSNKLSPVKNTTSSQKKPSPHPTIAKSPASATKNKNSSVPTNNEVPSMSRQQNQKLTPPIRLFISQLPMSTQRNAEAVISRINCGGPSTVNSTVVDSMSTSPVVKTPAGASTPLKSSLRKSGDPPSSAQQRRYSVAFESPEANNNDGSHRGSSSHENGSVPFLSPGTMESPNRMQSVVLSLQRQNEAQQLKLEQLQNQEAEMRKHLEQVEASYRQKMISMEAESLERMQEQARESEQQISSLQAQLEQAQELSSQGSVALRELKVVKDELEVLNHSKMALTETKEKLRKYKDKITELQDVKEALRKEQELHGERVDEVIRLESELQQLQSVKRQVDDYRIRAIEAEVKLVECQDYLRRMERQYKDQSAKNDNLYQDVIMQKEHMEELQRRIEEDVQRVSETAIAGIGEGINELNPELKEELLRLRNENLQLRAFQAKRTEDAVQYLEESLDDAKQLAGRYKDEFLRIKEELGSTQSSLHESHEREAKVQHTLQEVQERFCALERQCASIQEELESTGRLLQETKIKLHESETQNNQLLADVNEWKLKQQEAYNVAEERLHSNQQLVNDLDETSKALIDAEEDINQLNHNAEQMLASLNQNEEQLQSLQSILENTRWELEESQAKFAHKQEEAEILQNQHSALQKQISSLEEVLRVERTQRKEEVLEAQTSLETTRQLLETKSKKDLEELHSNMARLLDDERKANRKKDEDIKLKLSQLDQDWQKKYQELQERTTSALQNSRQQAQAQVDFIKQENAKDLESLKKEWDDDVAKIKKQSEETLDNFIRKGKEKVRVMQAKVHEEMQRLDDERRDIEEKYERLECHSSEREQALEEQLSSLKKQLEFVTSQMNQSMREADEHLDVIKKLDREKFKLSEENEQYRRQLGGRYGAGGQIQSQLEKLQKEYSVVVEENRTLKKQIQNGHDSGFSLETVDEEPSRSYRRGGVMDRRALSQLQKDFEERIDVLNNEKRDLIMKMSSQSTDVHKAEKRTWECEEEISRLKAENTSLKLRLERKEFADDVDTVVSANENRLPLESSFHSAQAMLSTSQIKTDSPGPPIVKSSPGIDRAKKNKMEQENILRNRVSSITGTPPRAGLTQNVSGSTGSPAGSMKASPRSPSKISKMASDVFRLGLKNGSPRALLGLTNESPRSRLGLTNGSPRSYPVSSENASSPSASSTQHHPYIQSLKPLDEYNQECNQS